MKLYEKLEITKGITSVVGSGGKTTLIRRLGEELKKDGFSVIVTTTTKIYIPDYCRLYAGSDSERMKSLLDRSGIVCAGRPFPAGCAEVKLGKSDITLEEMKAAADYVLVEADGSKHLPLKAHLPSEPVIPDETGRTVTVVGINGAGKPVKDVVHRAEVFSELSGLAPEEPVSVEAVARVINLEKTGDVVYISGINTDEDMKNAVTLAGLIEGSCVLDK